MIMNGEAADPCPFSSLQHIVLSNEGVEIVILFSNKTAFHLKAHRPDQLKSFVENLVRQYSEKSKSVQHIKLYGVNETSLQEFMPVSIDKFEPDVDLINEPDDKFRLYDLEPRIQTINTDQIVDEK
jgi:hypothetical protein